MTRAASSSEQLRSFMILARSAFSCCSVIAKASAMAGGTLRNRAFSPGPRITPSVYLPGSLPAASSRARSSSLNSRKRAICSASSGGIDMHFHHSIMLSMRLAESGKSCMFCVASHSHAPYLRHILVILTT